jgi:peptidoglycan/xylan/chitin deacetylase (PgdA/CDA1 family)
MRALAGLLGRPLSFLLLPLSLVPFLLVMPQVLDSHRLFDRRHKSEPLPAPAVRLSPAQGKRFQPVPAYSGAVPVLVYHGIGGRGELSVGRRAFAEQMAALRRMNFRSISIEQYARFRRGDRRGLPERPVLITFDGGRLDSYRGADRTLARFQFRATMFVRTAEVQSGNPFFLTWRELKAMARSGRWDVQPMAHAGHRLIAHNARGDTGAFYAFRRYTRSEGLESFADYERRVAADVFRLRDVMDGQGMRSHAVAVPFGNYGQLASNDPRVAPYVRGLLTRQFGVIFVQDPENDPGYMWLRDHSPAAERAARAAARKRAARRAAGERNLRR